MHHIRRRILAVTMTVACCGCRFEPDETPLVTTAPSTDAGPGSDANPGLDATPGLDASDPGQDGLSPREQAALADETPTPPALARTPSSIGHFGPARQASTYLSGPQSPNARVEVLDLVQTMGLDVGVSPWHVTTPREYADSAGASVWGATLTHVYKLAVDPAGFRFVDLFRVNAAATSIPWNHGALSDGRIIVPDQNGYFGEEDASRCATLNPSFLLFADERATINSPIRCDQAIELRPARLTEVCRVPAGTSLNRGRTGLSLTASYSGPLATLAVFGTEPPSIYMVLFDPNSGELGPCTFVDDSFATNEIASELLEDGSTAFYVPTEDAIVKVVHRPDGTLERRWERSVPVRERTGTTPTLVNTPDGERFVVTVDGRCATISLSNGLIGCSSEDTSNSRLIAVRRGDDVPPEDQVLLADLPPWLATTENSPASRRGYVIVANYSGYLPNGLLIPAGNPFPEGNPASWLVSPHAVPDFATGVVAMQWNPNAGTFEPAWEVANRQVSGVPTISAGANLVYGIGSDEQTRRTYLYAFLLEEDERGPPGTEILRIDLGVAPFRETTVDSAGNVVFPRPDYRLASGELFDPGNMLMVAHDRSLILGLGSAVARVSDP